MNPTTQKPGLLDSITSTLSRGSTGESVKALQQYLIGMNYPGVKADGIFGSITEQAVRQFQADNGLKSDGYFGPLSVSKAKSMGSSANTSAPVGSVPTTQESFNQSYADSLAKHPAFAGNSPEALSNAINTGDMSGILNSDGKTFSQADQGQAYADSEAALKPGFDITQKKDTQDTEASFQQTQDGYSNYLKTQADNFQQDKNNLDTTAANNGVLFSGGRAQKERNLASTYDRNQQQKFGDTSNSISNLARDYQYKYGDDSAQNLSKFYNLGGNTYNPNVARNGVGSQSLSAIYNPSGQGYQGTANVQNNTDTLKRSAGLLWNKGNKLLSTGYTSKY